MVEALKTHATEIASQAAELAEHLGAVKDDSLLPLVQAVALVDLEDVRSRLALVAERLMTHAPAPRERPARSH
jgi:hypothetical protein